MEGNGAKRRLVQATLFPHNETAINASENGLSDREDAVVEEVDEEWCGSSKKRKGTKRKGNSKLKKTPRANAKKEINGKETPTKHVNASDSPVIPKSSFFVKVSEQRQLKRQQNQLVSAESPEENGDICSVPSFVANGRTTPQKKKQQCKSTPRKEKRSSISSKKMKRGKRELQFDHIQFDLPSDEQPLQKLPDEILEAKLTADEIENGKDAPTKQVNVGDPPVVLKSSFFLKVSEQRQLKRQQNQLVSADSPEEKGDISLVPSSVANGTTTPQKQKQRAKSTPRKERRSSTPSKKMKSGKRELQFDHIQFDLPPDKQPLQTLPDLRLEAKLTAEENTRIFSGRQIHPFFLSRKGGKTSQSLTDPESNWSSIERKEKGVAFKPIHVFENVQDYHSTFNWGHWIFSERNATSELQCGSTPLYEGSTASLNFDNSMNVPLFAPTSLHQNPHRCPVPQEQVSNVDQDSNIMPKCTEDVPAGCIESVLQDHKWESNGFSNKIHLGGNLDSQLEEKLLQERIMSHYHTSHNQPENCLWTDKYQPLNAKQICGNPESVNFLSEWLHLWHTRGSLIIRGCTDEVNSTPKDDDFDYQQSDDDGEESLKNVLLVTGPVGCGKSASIYACARDQGFQIIEINASDWRSGALVKQKFGEAVESHWLQRTVENGTSTENKSLSKFFKAVDTDMQCSNDEVIELIHLPDEESGDVYSSPKKSVNKRPTNCQNEVKTLILFEDVDAAISEDHGFISTIQQLAVTAKRPMILTSNSGKPALPKSLDKLELNFSLPSAEELLGLANMICAAEKAEIHPYLLQRFVDHCRGDIRRTILLLQFWCQGQTLRTGNEQPTTYWPVPFDLDAGHHILPKIILWACPSLLSELVEVEIVKSLALIKETECVMGEIKVGEVNYYSSEDIRMQENEQDPIEVKKEKMLSFQSLNDAECTPCEVDPELLDICCSPVASTQKNSRRRVNTVLSSDSEDDFACGSIPLASTGELHEMKNTFHCLSTEIHHTPAEPVSQFKVDNLEGSCSRLPQIVDNSLVEAASRLHDMSIVPESNFVHETEIIHETELFSTTVTYCNFSKEAGSNWAFQNQDSMPDLKTASDSQLAKSLHIFPSDLELVGSDFVAVTASGCQEEVGVSLSKSEPDVPREFQLLDECSRVDIVRTMKSLDCAVADQKIDIMKETWKSLHNQSGDFKKYVTAEERSACQILKFSHGMSNLISEADLLLKDCHNLFCDSLLPLMIPGEKTHSYNYEDNQLEMSSILAQHGMCYYAKEIASLRSITGCQNNLDLASEMLSSSENSVALGKLASQNRRKVDRSSTETTECSYILKSSGSDLALDDILQTAVPSRSYLAAKGSAFHEYISTLGQISRYETSRLSNSVENKRKGRRGRVPQNYLSGSLAMSSEEIQLLDRHTSYAEGHRPAGDGSLR
ncbi:uncharacterized protein LOC121781273 isoform X1 [Salvia splendens]|uniref:uncharacterized protein LOC121781273 isoform X1 n=1 Tax=Salvia splendens TaxID=180675 RepID=UPI001C2664A8|nr:uncharacterized protein LOC121781273 isoform X1 [Salvia splendens]